MKRTLISMACTLLVLAVVCYASVNGAQDAIQKAETLTGSIQAKQLEKIELLNELQGITD